MEIKDEIETMVKYLKEQLHSNYERFTSDLRLAWHGLKQITKQSNLTEPPQHNEPSCRSTAEGKGHYNAAAGKQTISHTPSSASLSCHHRRLDIRNNPTEPTSKRTAGIMLFSIV